MKNESKAKDASTSVILSDDPTVEAVTVLVMLTCDENDAFMLRHCLRSLSKNLRGVSAEVKVIGRQKPHWLADSVWIDTGSDTSDHSNDSDNSLICRAVASVDTERIVLMTDRMFLIRPVNLADIAVLKAKVDTTGNRTVKLLFDAMGTTKHEVWNYQTNMPALFFKTPMLEVLHFMLNEKKTDDFHLPTVYFNLIYPDLRPLLLDWSHDGWLLPFVSKKPDIDSAFVKKLLATKKFMYIANNCGNEMVSLLKFLTPDYLSCETDIANED